MGNRTSTEEDEGSEFTGSDGQAPRLYHPELKREQWPIVYSPNYNIGFLGMERLHPFDSGKWAKVFQFLVDAGMLKSKEDIVSPHEVSEDELQLVHSHRYLESLRSSFNVALVVEVPPVAFLPNFIVQSRMLRPFRYHTGGTILAGKLAKERGWAINIGGGFHHCSSDEGGGFCAYADITLAVKFVFQHIDGIAKVMIVDFDAHQGNGHERDFINDPKVYIMDMYNRWIYPNDRHAKAAINKKIELDHHTSDNVYLQHIRNSLPEALDEFSPDMVLYNAGTDVLVGDPLGTLDITAGGVRDRDELVFQEVRGRGIPIFMVTSGGYQRNNARVIADSILNLRQKALIGPLSEDPHLADQLGQEGQRLEEGEGEEGGGGEEGGDEGACGEEVGGGGSKQKESDVDP